MSESGIGTAFGTVPTAASEAGVSRAHGTLDKVFAGISRTLASYGVFLDHYQRPAVLRRIRHRMQLQNVSTIEEYRALLALEPAEAAELIREVVRPRGHLLRDTVVVEALRAALLVRARETDRPLVWVPECGDGEEAFTAAMIAADTFTALSSPVAFTVVGSDRNADALRAAQSGTLTAALLQQLPPPMRTRFLEGGGLEARVVLELRRHCQFFLHDVIAQAPPCVDVDVVVARNLLMHLQPALQRRALEHLYAALRPRGMLLVGPLAEQLDQPDLFRLVQLAPGLYQRVERTRSPPRREAWRVGDALIEVFRGASTAMLLLDAGYAVSSMNASASRLLDEAPEDIVGVELLNLVDFADRARLAETLAALPQERRVGLDVVMAGGRSTSLTLSALHNRVLVELVDAGDTRLRMRATEQARRTDAVLRTVKDGIIVTDAEGLVIEFNEPAEHLTGWSRGDALHEPLAKCFRFMKAVRNAADGMVPVSLRKGFVDDGNGDYFLMHRDGRRIAVSLRTAAIGADGGQVVVFEDISERKLLAEELAYRATHDSVTGLLNRGEFELRVREAHERLRTEGGSAVLCFIDVDQFKVINDTLGHVAGDELLHELAGELRVRLTDDDAFARLGGDEFGVLMPGYDLDSARPLIDNLLEGVRRFRFYWAGQGYAVTISIGVGALDASTESITHTMSLADAACFAAKDAGRDRAHYAGDDDELPRRYADMSLVGKLGRALDEERFTLHFEDVVSAMRPERVVYLVRIRDQDDGLITPGAFIQAAERFFLMGALDRWVVRNALRGVARLPADDVIYALNVSGQSMGDDKFLAYVLAELDASGVDPGRICFEITETAAVSRLNEAIRFIRNLSDAGCRFALDDFGAGMASFSYLKNFDVDYLKIDGGFVRSMLENRSDLGVVRTLNRIGHEVGLRTIAEHVENRELLEPLRAMGVDWVQGRAIAKDRPFQLLLDGA
jgi:diguanylate cyclase (GGDEF)-like protein/PAS domain S-box-containing protein